MARTKDLNSRARKAILESAQKCFVAKGFAGTSIGDIATEAHVNKSLIYHYFKDKTALWKAVKESLLKDFFQREDMLHTAPSDTLENFLAHVTNWRFNIYDKGQDIVRIVRWQTLEEYAEIQGTYIFLGDDHPWCDAIRVLQEKGLVRDDYPVEMMMKFITCTAAGPFLVMGSEFTKKTDDEKEKYRQLILETLKAGLKA